MISLLWFLLGLGLAGPALAQSTPELRLAVVGNGVEAVAPEGSACDGRDYPDTPARAIHLADGSVQLYATDRDNRVDEGPDLLHLKHRCAVVYRGSGRDDPGAYDDRAWIASPWTEDGHTIWAVVHNEFQGQLRKALCPSGQYMDCWFNALTLAVSHDGGTRFERAPGRALVAALPYRYDEVGVGHHGYFNPSNIVDLGGEHYMFAFATHAKAQLAGNCLLRSDTIGNVRSWRGWDGTGFTVTFVDPYFDPKARPILATGHICAPVDGGVLRWPITSLVRHRPSKLFIVLMQDTTVGGGVYYATSPDLLTWSQPALLISAVGLSGWVCGAADPIAYPSLLDVDSDRNFQTVGANALMFATHFDGAGCNPGAHRNLVRWTVQIEDRGQLSKTSNGR